MKLYYKYTFKLTFILLILISTTMSCTIFNKSATENEYSTNQYTFRNSVVVPLETRPILEISVPGIAIESISFDVILPDTTSFTIGSLSSIGNTQPPDESIYQYILINHSKSNSRHYLSNIHFTVEHNWLSDSNQNIVLQHFSDKWNKLPTSNIDSNKTHIIYKASTNQFGLFAITSNKDNTLKKPLESSEKTTLSSSITSKQKIDVVEPTQKKYSEKEPSSKNITTSLPLSSPTTLPNNILPQVIPTTQISTNTNTTVSKNNTLNQSKTTSIPTITPTTTPTPIINNLKTTPSPTPTPTPDNTPCLNKMYVSDNKFICLTVIPPTITPNPQVTSTPIPTATSVPKNFCPIRIYVGSQSYCVTSTPTLTPTITPTPTSTPTPTPTPTTPTPVPPTATPIPPTPIPTPDPRYGIVLHGIDENMSIDYLNSINTTWYLNFNRDMSQINSGKKKLPYLKIPTNKNAWESNIVDNLNSIPDEQLESLGYLTRLQLKQLAQLYPDAYWYLLGEPNRHGNITGEKFAKVFFHYSQGLKSGNLSAKILGPSPLNWDFICIGCAGYTSGRTWTKNFIIAYESLYEEKPPVYAWGIDVYPIDWINTPNNSSLENKKPIYKDQKVMHWEIAVDQIMGMREFLNTIPEYQTTPIWITEIAVHVGYDAWIFLSQDPVKIKPVGSYNWVELSNYTNGILNWLENTADILNIERWFFYTSWRDINNVLNDGYMGTIFFNNQSDPDSLNCLGKVYKNRTTQSIHNISCNTLGEIEE